ncbi:MAG: alpha/beta hydrolase [Erysipelotrichales bacterium]|nr:alpha/beta hydrolase [Erysipelotrichales bacterium]
MKVTHNMLAKDLRIMGEVYRIVMSAFPHLKKGSNPLKKKTRGNTDTTKSTYQVYITREDGSELRLLVHKPKNYKGGKPGVLWIHGGGFATGMPEMIYMSMARVLLKECVVVTPEYTLSIEKPYPAALNDCFLALKWMHEHADELQYNNDQLFVGGESAGGNLAIALCLYARDNSNIKIACQMPLYPMIDDSMNTNSMKDNDAPVWNEDRNREAWKLYLDGLLEIPVYAAPARETNYHNLPPCISFVGTIEPFYDETKVYINNLQKHNIPTHFTEFAGAFHAFDMMVPWSKSAKAAKEFFLEHFDYACQHYRGK